MKNIFVDTGPFQALNDKNDQYRVRAINVFNKFQNHALNYHTTDYILDEVYTGLLIKSGYQAALHFEKFFSKANYNLVHITPELFSRTKEAFRRFNKDKKWSFTDCTSYVVMKELKIKTAFTFDNNFEQMGFEILT
ncbi:hypothetical protein A2630_00415 [Candidatus Woesebacteria bacterium RIFCSPHIGHO2_01_FULL_44_10]|uniref:PIN domain-containing protein n=1 Tax=Candidatus Woesebacteria bacterium RIFCSPLOWO2_01_FULL_44_14 TaxID=1802525 RepID=A0A1F8C377_9BACT|nr:MAG: hypothetical protein A2630_00415 [Candidatus Woesebacteria bacterium RIFCSPHIGHO2_01_FULL_44_10]OGM53728.1 MAG: hypothetical protein A3F62_03630 [Candidatus Woesebacteria bacterium RIFCSPHIGHO2_12_FULL_44_11]OGM70075.1 MAG: hypothetical protein A2975_03295 [Candidatus Woesebacteria bacterium RIFCSPLOWO2_01_FULL_44_14]